jgi:hypothetical protein
MSIARRIQEIETHIGDVYDTINYSYDTTGINKNIINIPKYLKKGYIDIINNGIDTLYNNFPKVSGIGSNLSLTPTYEAPIKLNEIQGNTLQENTPTPDNPVNIETVTGLQKVNVCGKNLFDKSNTTVGKNWNGDNMVYSIATNDYIPVEEGQSYVISVADMSSYSSTTIVRFDKDKNVIIPAITTNPFTIPTGTKYIKLSIRSATTHTWTQEELNNAKYQLEKGSTATEYEEYKGNTYEVNLGKNLFDKDNVNMLNVYFNANGVIANADTRSFYIPCKPNTTYTIQKNGSARFRIGTTETIPENGVSVANYVANDNDTPITITTSSTANYLICYFYATFDTNTKTLEQVLDTIQIEVGTQATLYSPYFTPIELNKTNDNVYQDSIKKSSGKNLFDKSTITTGKYIDASGNLVNDNSNFVGDYIPIDNTKSYYASQNAGGVIRAGYYDSNKAFISRQLISTNYGSLTIPNNTVYVRLSCYNQSLDTLQLELGTQQTSYEPYGKVWYVEKQYKKYDVYSNITTLVGTYNNVNYLRIVKPSDYLGYNTYDDVPFLFSHGTYRSQGGNWDNINNINTITNRANLGNWWLCIEKNTTLEEIKEKLIGSYTIYPLATPTYTEITNTELINQLEELYTAKSQEGTTNISITSEDLEMILNVSALKIE